MSRSTSKQSQLRCGTIVIVAASLGTLISCGGTAADDSAGNNKTATPIKHVIVLIGENCTFDHVFGTYNPEEGTDGLQSPVERHYQRGRHAGSQFCPIPAIQRKHAAPTELFHQHKPEQ